MDSLSHSKSVILKGSGIRLHSRDTFQANNFLKYLLELLLILLSLKPCLLSTFKDRRCPHRLWCHNLNFKQDQILCSK